MNEQDKWLVLDSAGVLTTNGPGAAVTKLFESFTGGSFMGFLVGTIVGLLDRVVVGILMGTAVGL